MTKKTPWEIALRDFLQPWKKKKEVIGALVCGSFVTGRPSKHSDIDVHIFLAPSVRWRERGNKVIRGYLIEYFANSVQVYSEYFEKDYQRRRKVAAHMIYIGRALFDKTGGVKQVQREASRYLRKPYLRLKKQEIEQMKYRLWDSSDNLEEIFEARGEEFLFAYYNCLYDLYEIYAAFLRYDSVPVHKLRRLLMDREDKKKYRMDDFPDPSFATAFIKALKRKGKHEMMREFRLLTAYVLQKMGGFHIDGWKLRTSVHL